MFNAGGNYNNGANAGVFYLNGNNDLSNARWNYLARISDQSLRQAGVYPCCGKNRNERDRRIVGKRNPASVSESMKKKCKNIDITDCKTVLPWVSDCIYRHKKRYDFKALLLRHGVTKDEYFAALETYDYSAFDKAIESIAREACGRIKERNLDLPPVHIRKMTDTTTGKTRDIGKESAMQQVYDHIAVHSCEEIFRCRMVEQQMSSIKGRGQIKGVQLIRKYITKDNGSIRYAKRHGMKYGSKCKYHVKLDIRKCYPSANMEIFMKLLEHDCANGDIIWLWRTLLESHRTEGYTGFMIGALPSQWACQLMLSCIYRKAMSIAKTRRGKKIRSVTHMVMFMDDMLLFGSDRQALLEAVREIITYAKEALGFEIKQNFHIKELETEGVDMMGFIVYRNGKTKMRGRNFIRSRRLMLRFIRTGRLVLPQAKRLISFKGFWKYSDSRRAGRELKTNKIFSKCALLISSFYKEAENAKIILHGRTRSDSVFATA